MAYEVKQIRWHSMDPLYAVDVCPKTQRVATGGADRKVKIWRIERAPVDEAQTLSSARRSEEGEAESSTKKRKLEALKEVERQSSFKVTFLANLEQHSGTVNVVRFSPNGKLLASAADDHFILIWELVDDTMGKKATFGDNGEEEKGIETWKSIGLLRGHTGDIYDLAWSQDGNYLLSGSVDNSAIVWDVKNRSIVHHLREHRHFVQGCTFDPLGRYFATMSCDRSVRVYRCSAKREKQRKYSYPLAAVVSHQRVKDTREEEDTVEGQPPQPQQPPVRQRLFHDETLLSFFRRLTFSPDASMLVTPAGLHEASENAVLLFSSEDLNSPVVSLRGFTSPAVAVRFHPDLFKLNNAPDEDTKVEVSEETASKGETETSETEEKPTEVNRDAKIEETGKESTTTEEGNVTINAEIGKERTLDEQVDDILRNGPKPFKTSKDTPAKRSKPAVDVAKIRHSNHSTDLPLDHPYAMVFAVVTLNAVHVYRTDRAKPIFVAQNLHYASLTDVAFMADSDMMVVTSKDGFCSLVHFDGIQSLGEKLPLDQYPSGMKHLREVAEGACAWHLSPEELVTAAAAPESAGDKENYPVVANTLEVKRVAKKETPTPVSPATKGVTPAAAAAVTPTSTKTASALTPMDIAQ
eukprot:Clim_evm6s197 gene=Clim_evmTU6s197